MPETIRVIYVIDNLRAEGAQRALVLLAEGLAVRGYEQCVFCLNDSVDPAVRTALEGCGARLEVIGRWRMALGLGVFILVRRFRRWTPQVVQTFLSVSDLVGRMSAHLAGVPVLLTSIRARNVDKRGWRLWLDRRTMKWADKVVFNSRDVVPFSMEQEGVRAEQVVCIPNGVRACTADRSLARSRLCSELALDPASVLIGTVGRLTEQKGHRHLLAAFARVLPGAPTLALIIAGDGPLRPALEREANALGIAARIRLVGYRRDTSEIYAALDVYVHPAVWEGMPNALMEAMAAGLPVVATAVDGSLELVKHGETGWLVPPEDPLAMAERIAAALGDSETARRVGEAARRHMAAHFSVDAMVDAYDRLYRRLSAESRKRRSTSLSCSGCHDSLSETSWR